MTAQDFTQFAAGDEQALQRLYKADYGYVTGWLVYREPFGRREALAMGIIFAGVAVVKWFTSQRERSMPVSLSQDKPRLRT